MEHRTRRKFSPEFKAKVVLESLRERRTLEEIAPAADRIRDLRSHAAYVHSLDKKAIAVGVMVLNAATVFQSKLKVEPTIHKKLDVLLPKFIGEIRLLPERPDENGPNAALEARCVILVDFQGDQGSPAKVITKLPAPQIGDNLHYEAMIRNVCDHYSNRFSRVRPVT